VEQVNKGVSVPEAAWNLTKSDQAGLTSNVDVKVTWDAIDSQSMGVHIDLGNNRVIALRGGTYLVGAHMGLDPDGGTAKMDDTRCKIFKNGVETVSVLYEYETTNIYLQPIGIVYKMSLEANDYIEIYINADVAGSSAYSIISSRSAGIFEDARFIGVLIDD